MENPNAFSSARLQIQFDYMYAHWYQNEVYVLSNI